ncbi:ATP-binding protein [Desertihabitans aurantiacus]|uniref:ATP-binding protein n=1 Tax=Desertihabitans aurantiacus TaxID=2282477 RepID=UPI000DF7B214|nr:ATP-binding protein [Desertihabitans aurantiacus]
MPCLILLNGVPGAGKSTLARRYAAEHPLTLVLDVDLVRALLGAWQDHSADAGRLARRIALAMSAVALEQGHDVVVPQYLGRLPFVEQLAGLAEEAGVPFVETVLRTPLPVAVARFTERAGTGRDAAEVAAPVDDPAGLVAEADAAIRAVVAARPATVVLDDVDTDPEVGYRQLLTAVGAARTSAA